MEECVLGSRPDLVLRMRSTGWTELGHVARRSAINGSVVMTIARRRGRGGARVSRLKLSSALSVSMVDGPLWMGEWSFTRYSDSLRMVSSDKRTFSAQSNMKRAQKEWLISSDHKTSLDLPPTSAEWSNGPWISSAIIKKLHEDSTTFGDLSDIITFIQVSIKLPRDIIRWKMIQSRTLTLLMSADLEASSLKEWLFAPTGVCRYFSALFSSISPALGSPDSSALRHWGHIKTDRREWVILRWACCCHDNMVMTTRPASMVMGDRFYWRVLSAVPGTDMANNWGYYHHLSLTDTHEDVLAPRGTPIECAR